jgi:hypothetical protein
VIKIDRDEIFFIKSLSVLRYLWRLFNGRVAINFMTLEVIYSGGWQKIKKAAKLLESKGIWYKIEWVRIKDGSRPKRIILMLDNISLKK